MGRKINIEKHFSTLCRRAKFDWEKSCKVLYTANVISDIQFGEMIANAEMKKEWETPLKKPKFKLGEQLTIVDDFSNNVTLEDKNKY